MSEVTTRTVEANGYRTNTLESAPDRQQTVILLHGGGPGAAANSNWTGFIPGLSDDFHVLAPDLVGHGYTDHPGSKPTSIRGWMRIRVEQVLAMMDALGVERTHLVGNSMGGALAMHLAMAAPERICRVSLMGSAGGKAEPTPEVKRMVTFYQDPSLDALENLTKWFVYDEQVLGDAVSAVVKERYEEIMRPEVRASFESFFSSPPEQMAVPPAALRRMTQPFLVVHGREDRFVLPESSVYLQHQLPNARLHIFPKCGHWVQIEKRRTYTRLLLDFLTELD